MSSAIATQTDTVLIDLTESNTDCSVWEERGRLQVTLYGPNGSELISVSDSDAYELIEDGFLDPRNFHGSILEYWVSLNGHFEAELTDNVDIWPDYETLGLEFEQEYEERTGEPSIYRCEESGEWDSYGLHEAGKHIAYEGKFSETMDGRPIRFVV